MGPADSALKRRGGDDEVDNILDLANRDLKFIFQQTIVRVLDFRYAGRKGKKSKKCRNFYLLSETNF